jgi:hypothetical protein
LWLKLIVFVECGLSTRSDGLWENAACFGSQLKWFGGLVVDVDVVSDSSDELFEVVKHSQSCAFMGPSQKKRSIMLNHEADLGRDMNMEAIVRLLPALKAVG